MKKKLLYTSITIIVAVIGLFALQVDWLIKTYKSEKESKASLADTALVRALFKYHQEQEDSIQKVLYPQLKRIADTVQMNYTPQTNSLTIKLHTRILPAPKGMTQMTFNTSRTFGDPHVQEATNVDMSRTVGNIRVEYDYQSFTQGPMPDPREQLAKGIPPYFGLNKQDKVGPALEQLFGDTNGARAKFYFKTDSAKIIQFTKIQLDKMGETLLSKTIHLKFRQGYNAPVDRDKQSTSLYKSYRAQGLNGYYGKPRLVAVSYASLPNIIALRLLMYLLTSGFLMFLLIFSIVYLMKIILRQKQLAEMKDDFVNNLTHEFKTPIATVLAAVEGLQKFNALDDKEKTDRYLDISRTELNRLNDMVTKVLNISSYEKKELELDLQTIDLEAMVNEVTHSETFRAVKPVKFSVNIAPGVKQITADPLHFKNVLSNLVDNSVKYSKESVDISISAYADNQMVHIKVKDNGIGIPASAVKYVFDKFYRVTNGNLYNVKGNGLGLSYVKFVVEAHGGTISLKSEINMGTEFLIAIPLK